MQKSVKSFDQAKRNTIVGLFHLFWVLCCGPLKCPRAVFWCGKLAYVWGCSKRMSTVRVLKSTEVVALVPEEKAP